MAGAGTKFLADTLGHRASERFIRLLRHSSGQALIALIAILVLATVTSPLDATGARIFLDPGNLTDILRQVSLIGIIALGMTFVILTGGIDLSVGSILALSTVLAATVLTESGPGLSPAFQIAEAIALSVFACTAIGAVNGLVIAFLKVQPFIVTLATMIGVRGLAKWFTGNENIDIGFGEDVAAQFASIFREKILVVGIYVAAAIIFGILLSKTVFGRHAIAIGDNPTAARYAGLRIPSIQTAVYSLSGLLAGISGVLYAAENHQGNPNAGVSYELDAIAAVVIGGARLSGGSGNILGTIIGTLIMGVLTNLLRLNNVDSNVEMMIKAVIIIFAVSIQRGRSV